MTGTPDTIRTTFSVNVTSGTLDDAVSRANAAAARVQQAFRAHGVASKDLQTSDVSLYSYVSHPKGGPTTRHFVMSESLTVTLRSIDKASAAIQAAIDAGGSAVSLNGLSLDLTDNGPLLTAARKAAFESAKGKATQYAGLAGRSLGQVTSITETVDNPGVVETFRGDLAAASAPIPIAKGSQDVGVTVTVVFTLS